MMSHSRAQSMKELIHNTTKGLIVGLLKALDAINCMATKINIQRIPRQILHSFSDLPIWPNFKAQIILEQNNSRHFSIEIPYLEKTRITRFSEFNTTIRSNKSSYLYYYCNVLKHWAQLQYTCGIGRPNCPNSKHCLKQDNGGHSRQEKADCRPRVIGARDQGRTDCKPGLAGTWDKGRLIVNPG